MKFSKLTEMFDQIEQTSGRTEMTQLLADLFKQATPHEASFIAYLSLGSLRPPYLSVQFNFAEKSLIKVLSQLNDVTVETVKRHLAKLGDLGLVAQHDLKHEPSQFWSVTDMIRWFDEFVEIAGTGSQEQKEHKLLLLLKTLDGASMKYVIRALDGNLRLGFSDMTLLDAFSWMQVGDKSLRSELEDAYNVCADIGLIVKTLKHDGIDAIRRMAIIPGIPIRPSAAERMPDAASVIKKLGHCVAQPKLDGFRLQVHISRAHGKKQVSFFSRNLQDMSHMFPDLVKAVEALDVDILVAEGEAICHDPSTGGFLPFQETVKRKRKHNVDQFAQDYPLVLYLFDLLYLNGKSMLSVDHAHRRQLMLDLCSKLDDSVRETIIPIEEVTIKTADQLYDYFEKTVSVGLEGLVVKRPDAHYQPGKRNFNWIKLKREETGSLDDTVDCVILGYYHGQGKRAQFGIGALLVGVYDPDQDAFMTVAKIGTGLTDHEWREQKHSCDKLAVQHQPKNVICAKELRPDVWVSPEIVCMIRADEITLSPTHTAGAVNDLHGYALRFPRLKGYRPDKKATEATTVTEIKRLYDLQFERAKRKKSSKKES